MEFKDIKTEVGGIPMSCELKDRKYICTCRHITVAFAIDELRELKGYQPATKLAEVVKQAEGYDNEISKSFRTFDGCPPPGCILSKVEAADLMFVQWAHNMLKRLKLANPSEQDIYVICQICIGAYQAACQRATSIKAQPAKSQLEQWPPPKMK
jgi:hypothetical protein